MAEPEEQNQSDQAAIDAQAKADAENQAQADLELAQQKDADAKANEAAAAALQDVSQEKASSSRQGTADPAKGTDGASDDPETTDVAPVQSAETAVAPDIQAADHPVAVAVNPIYGAAVSAMAATGGTVHVPDSPAAVAEQATALGLANDHATGGYAPPVDTNDRQPVVTRLWSMDNDHTENNRNSFDPVKPDCVTVS